MRVEAEILMLIRQHKQICGTADLGCHQDASGVRTTDLEIQRVTRESSCHLPGSSILVQNKLILLVPDPRAVAQSLTSTLLLRRCPSPHHLPFSTLFHAYSIFEPVLNIGAGGQVKPALCSFLAALPELVLDFRKFS